MVPLIPMGFDVLFALLLITSYHLQHGDSRVILSIKDFLSDSDSKIVDHSQAFQAAWRALCGGRGRGQGSSLVIHARETYTIQPQRFEGPCASPHIHIQIDGTIEAPKMVKDWGSKKSECWLCFERVTGLVLNGSGVLNSNGQSWWSSVALSSRREAVRFLGCQNILYNGLTQINSPRNHISVTGCTNATLLNLHLIAPSNSPNTNGIDISVSHNIQIRSSSIKTGDDCISIQGGSYDINITYVTCGPGHGISIGSLGKGGANDIVQNVNVRHCTFTRTENGARIKTWPGGRGFVKNILYEDITMINVRSPIIIDQHYCNGVRPCPQPAGATALKVSGVTYRYFKGTSLPDVTAVKLDCDQRTVCDSIVMEHINITSSSQRRPLTSYCRFAHLIRRFVSIGINCGFHVNPKTPSVAPYVIPQTPYYELPAPTAQPPSPASYVIVADLG
ncbi:PREDICTED: probable polygalacturonase At3g15720 [Camelina sativa]|uniref:Probable polygalacturonase At3g15720 n=1 Tax=Camelina sativa TaxID=90675 RepID=A0ABM1QQH9_CAMSA|nr:PREDICTED: probable polygalacturonase At3g15720 [Camelina sativa]